MKSENIDVKLNNDALNSRVATFERAQFCDISLEESGNCRPHQLCYFNLSDRLIQSQRICCQLFSGHQVEIRTYWMYVLIGLPGFISVRAILIIGLCILLRVYSLNIGITSVRNQEFFSARFYCALLTLHVFSAPFGGHLQVVRKHKKYLRQSLYIQRIRWVGMYKVNIVVR
jgi:hypothetical protein